jgi:hypothetical protein
MAVNIAVLIIIILAVLILSAQSPRWVGRRMLTSATERVAGACSRRPRNGWPAHAHVKSDGCYPGPLLM